MLRDIEKAAVQVLLQKHVIEDSEMLALIERLKLGSRELTRI